METRGHGTRRAAGTNGTASAERQQGQGDQTRAGANAQALYRMSGVDATHIDAIGRETLEVVLSEYGLI